jgi:hypothetical protein
MAIVWMSVDLEPLLSILLLENGSTMEKIGEIESMLAITD